MISVILCRYKIIGKSCRHCGSRIAEMVCSPRFRSGTYHGWLFDSWTAITIELPSMKSVVIKLLRHPCSLLPHLTRRSHAKGKSASNALGSLIYDGFSAI